MESRGIPDARSRISRRSCDQCRTRKIGCDRGSPCSNCVSGRMECTHSAIAAKSTAPKQRVLISGQYERKIDDITRDVSDIKAILQGFGPTDGPIKRGRPQDASLNHGDFVSTENDLVPIAKHRKLESPKPKNISSWDHPVQIVDFVKAVVESSTSPTTEDGLASSLKSLVNLMSDTSTRSQFPGISAINLRSPSEALSTPPLDAILVLLRWVKAHQHFHRVVWISSMLPISMFEDICRKVYFAVDEYSHVDYILAMGFLSYMFSEHSVSTGSGNSGDHSQMCQDALSDALSRLPLVLPSTLEVVAALLIATLHSVECSKSTSAWIYISSAINHCQTLRYHRLEPSNAKQSRERDLFQSVYKFEKGLALRLGRPSGIRDTEIALHPGSDEHRATRSARIQGKVYDQLYSFGGLESSEERGILARELADEVREILKDIRSEISQCLDEGREDPMRELYLRGDLVCHTSLLALILRSVPSSYPGPDVSGECITTAREVFELHQECMVCVRNSNDPLTMTRYLKWAILHVPFVPFSIIFTRAVQLSDLDDLARLGQFAESLKPNSTQDGESSPTHPYRLYDLLYQTARLYIESGHQMMTTTSTSGTTAVDSLDMLNGQDTSEFINDMGGFDPMLGQFDTSQMELGEWFQGNQQLFRLLDEGMPF